MLCIFVTSSGRFESRTDLENFEEAMKRSDDIDIGGICFFGSSVLFWLLTVATGGGGNSHRCEEIHIFRRPPCGKAFG